MATQKNNSKKDESRHELMPEIREVTVGIKNPRKEKIYPLSVTDQLDLADTITEVLSTIMDLERQGVLKGAAEDDADPEEQKDNTLAIVRSLLTTLRDNIPLIIEKIFDDVQPSEISNNQMLNIAFLVYEMNYEDLTKNLKHLFVKTKSQTKVESLES